MPISGVGVKSDGTLGSVDANGNEVNPDGSPLPDAQQLKPLAPPTGVTSGTPTATPTPDTTKRDAYIAQLAADHKGQIGSSVPETVKLSAAEAAKAGASTQATGYDVYTFGDGSSVAIDSSGNVAQGGLKLASSSTKAPTDAQALQQAGFISVGSGTSQQIYQQSGTDANGKPTYVLSNASAVSNLLNNQATQAKTQLDQLTAQKQTLDNQVLADPTNQALVQQKAQLDNQYIQAQTASQNATAAKTASDNLIAQQKAPGEIAQTAATTTNTLATAQKTTALLPTDVQSAQLAVQKAQQDLQNNPNQVASQLAYQQAQTNYQQALANSTTAKAGEPTQWTPNTTAPSTQYWDPTSQSVQTQTNPNYQPTDPGRMTVQLQQQASGMQQTLQQQVAAGKLTSDQAASQFDQWWNTNVEPMKASIAQTQATQQSAIGQQQALTGYYNAEAANLPATLAQNASDAAQKNAISMLPYTTGAGFGQALGSAMSGGWKNVNPQQIAQATTFQLPNLQEIGRQGAAAALANISPTAQMHLNTPGPLVATPAANGMPPIASLLNQSQYGFGAPSMGGAPGAPMAQPPMAPPPMAAPPAAPPPMAQPPMAPPAPAAPAAPPFDWNALMARQQQDAQAQAAQAQIPASAWGTYAPAS